MLDLLPQGQRTKVLTLMGFNPTSAGGLMGVEFVAVPADARVREALAAVASSGTCSRRRSPVCMPWTTRACSAASPGSSPWCRRTRVQGQGIYDDDPVRIGTDTDVVDVAVPMSDYNLITIPVVDESREMIGVITVDDVLEATLPEDGGARRRRSRPTPTAATRLSVDRPSM